MVIVLTEKVECWRKIQEEKKKRGQTRGGKGEVLSLLPPIPPPHFPSVQFNSLPTDHCTLLSERQEQATHFCATYG